MTSQIPRSELLRTAKILEDQAASLRRMVEMHCEPIDNCNNCEYRTDYKTNFCAKWNKDIPENFIEKGCDEFIPLIPF